MIILVTGANRGLGYELVKEGLARGHQMIAAVRTVSEELKSLADEYGERLYIEHIDVADETSVAAGLGNISARFDHIDGLINNAAVLLETKLFDGDLITGLSLTDFETTLNVNVMGVVRMLQYFMPLLYKSKDAFIINVSSEGAKLRPEGHHYIAYATSKSALNMYTQRMRNWLHVKMDRRDIRVYMVHPGRMNTVMGVENAQIEAGVPAIGLMNIIDRVTPVEESEIPFIDYNGHPMPY